MSLSIDVRPMSDLLQEHRLSIPSYQRPYVWAEKQIIPLIHDLQNKKDEDVFLMGNVILHDDGKKLNIVDGQQRLLTCTIIDSLLNADTNSALLNQQFHHTESITNLQNCVQIVRNIVNKSRKLPILNEVYFIVVTTNELDDAFTFFDSQNTRGKKLEDYDILKAHHLRFIEDYSLASTCSKEWEKIETKHQPDLSFLLYTMLARGRKWTNSDVTEPNILQEFRSQRTKKKDASEYILNKYQQAALFTTWKINYQDNKALSFKFADFRPHISSDHLEIQDDYYQFMPFQITQSIEGGELFFWYVQKYFQVVQELFSDENKKTSEDFKIFLKQLDNYNYNIGANYINQLYKGALLFYFDKFGYHFLDDIAEYFFYSIYWLRLNQSTVQYASIYKYIRERFNPFSIIREASFPEYILYKTGKYLEDKYKGLNLTKGSKVIYQIQNEVIDNQNVGLLKHRTLIVRFSTKQLI